MSTQIHGERSVSPVTCLRTNHKGQPHSILTLTPTETPAVQVGPPRYTMEEGADLFEAYASRRMVLRSESELFLDSAWVVVTGFICL